MTTDRLELLLDWCTTMRTGAPLPPQLQGDAAKIWQILHDELRAGRAIDSDTRQQLASLQKQVTALQEELVRVNRQLPQASVDQA